MSDFIELQDATWKRLNEAKIYLEEFEDEPFILFTDWEQVSLFHEIVNTIESPEEWERWKDIYTADALVFGTAIDKRFSDLRLGQFGAYSLAKSPRLYDQFREAVSEGVFTNKATAARILHNKERATPYHSDPPYQVPEGLIEVDRVAEWGFEDEWDRCSECAGIVRTSPEHYGWRPRYWNNPNGIVCEDCIDPGDYLEYHRNNPDSAVNDDLVDPESYGWTPVEIDFSQGLHHGMDSDPKAIMKILMEADIDSLFTYMPSQFYIDFTVYVREWNLEKATHLLKHGNTDLPYSVAEETSKALKGEPAEVDVRIYKQDESGRLVDQDGNVLWDEEGNYIYNGDR